MEGLMFIILVLYFLLSHLVCAWKFTEPYTVTVWGTHALNRLVKMPFSRKAVPLSLIWRFVFLSLCMAAMLFGLLFSSYAYSPRTASDTMMLILHFVPISVCIYGLLVCLNAKKIKIFYNKQLAQAFTPYLFPDQFVSFLEWHGIGSLFVGLIGTVLLSVPRSA